MEVSSKIYEEALITWGHGHKGVGTVIINPPLDGRPMVLGCISKIYNKLSSTKIIILVDSFTERIDLINYFKSVNDENLVNNVTKGLKYNTLIIVTESLLQKQLSITNGSNYIIAYNLKSYSEDTIRALKDKKFKLVVTTSQAFNVFNAHEVIMISPILDCFRSDKVKDITDNPPVKETLIGISIPENSEVFKTLKSYNDYITASINIFGSFNVLQQAMLGNKLLNISGNQICENIARENGWSDTLDMSEPFNVRIDEYYNPNILRERVNKTHELIRCRIKLLSDIDLKIVEVINIVKNNKDSNILIINKNGEFAKLITDSINTDIGNICGNYHNNLPTIDAVDINGNPILVKSGANKGKRKQMGAKAQKTLTEKLFNNGTLRVISTNSAPDKDLSIDIDIVIITSPLCETIESYIYRLSQVNIRPSRLQLYTMYCTSTLEEKRLNQRNISKNHEIVNNEQNNTNNNNFSTFSIVD